MNREAILRRAFLAPSTFCSGELQLHPFSLWTLDAAEHMGLNYFLGGAGAALKFTAAERRFQLTALAWAHSTEFPEDDIDRAIYEDSWKPLVEEYKRRPEVTSAFPALVDYLRLISVEVLAATVRVIDKPSEKKQSEDEDTPPDDLIEPLAGAGIIWTLSGGQLLDAEQFRFLYRGLSLPRALSFYHCALHSALKWTVPIESEDQAREEVKKAKAVGAAVVRSRERKRRGLF